MAAFNASFIIKKNNILALIALVLLAVYFILVGLNYSGYCFEQGRWLSDEEKINLVASEVIKPGSVMVSDIIKKNDYIYVKKIPYQDIYEFFKKNNDCCKIRYLYHGEGDYNPFSFWDYAFLNGGMVVVLNYLENYYDKNDIPRSQMVERQFVVSNCGVKVNNMF